jgi:PadR family transcriptional regulator, regulatory protein PadR
LIKLATAVEEAGGEDTRADVVDGRKISSYNRSMRRRPDTLLPIEVSILAAGVDLRRDGATTFYGFSIAKEIREREGARRLTAHGTLYKALDRMKRAGLLASCWEDPLVAARERRPRRRLYEVTSAGEQALAKAQAERPRPTPRPAEGLAGL